MGASTKIEWCHHTFNHVRGCTKMAAGCANCYAEAQAKRNPKVFGIWGPTGTRVVASEDMWGEPKKWNSDAERDGVRRRVFCASLADVFEEWGNVMRGPKGGFLHHAEKWQRRDGKPYIEISDIAVGKSRVTMADVRARLFRLIDETPHLDWLLLSKRPENAIKMWPAAGNGKDPGSLNYLRRENVWLGASIACQEDAERNIPLLLKCRDLAPVLWLSAEPLVGSVDLRTLKDGSWYDKEGAQWYDALAGRAYWSDPSDGGLGGGPAIDWVVCGGESGRNARPCNVEWIRSVVSQCQDVGLPVFVKQLGSQPTEPDGTGFVRHVMLRDQKGGDPSEWPEDLHVREFPGVASR